MRLILKFTELGGLVLFPVLLRVLLEFDPFESRSDLWLQIYRGLPGGTRQLRSCFREASVLSEQFSGDQMSLHQTRLISQCLFEVIQSGLYADDFIYRPLCA